MGPLFYFYNFLEYLISLRTIQQAILEFEPFHIFLE